MSIFYYHAHYLMINKVINPINIIKFDEIKLNAPVHKLLFNENPSLHV